MNENSTAQGVWRWDSTSFWGRTPQTTTITTNTTWNPPDYVCVGGGSSSTPRWPFREIYTFRSGFDMLYPEEVAA